MRKRAGLTLLLLLLPLQAAALDTSELLGLVAMPLAVAAVSEVTDVPASELGQVVAVLNQAAMPPAEFVQVIRYVPVALAEQEERPRFVQFVRDEVSGGATGGKLVQVIGDRLRTYEVTPQFVTLTEPATTWVIADGYVPPMVMTRVTELRSSPSRTASLQGNDLLALIAMPLAVNALSGITGIPMNELSSFVSTLNSANVAPVQVVEVLRYVPVALVDDSGPQFVQYVRTEFDDGLRGDALVDVIVQRLRTYDVSPQIATAPSRVVYVENQFVPAVVVNRIAERRSHPHGGPPGQLKKQVGVQTGAEIVHGSAKRERPRAKAVRAAPVERRAERVERQRVQETTVSPGQIKKNDRGKGPGQSQGKGPKGPGKSKGKGKD